MDENLDQQSEFGSISYSWCFKSFSAKRNVKELYETKVRKVLNWALKKVINSEKSFNIELVRGNLQTCIILRYILVLLEISKKLQEFCSYCILHVSKFKHGSFVYIFINFGNIYTSAILAFKHFERYLSNQVLIFSTFYIIFNTKPFFLSFEAF